MKIISLFFPCLISILIRHKRRVNDTWKMPIVLFEYGINVLINVWITMSIVTYVFLVRYATIDALNRFSFFSKYTAVAIIVAILVPYAEEILKKYIEVKFTVRSKMRKKRKIWKNINNIFISSAFFLCFLLLSSSDWFLKNFSEMEFSAVVYQVFSPMKGTGAGILNEYCKECLYPSIFAGVVCGVTLHIYDSVLKNIILCFDIRVIKKRIYLESGDRFSFFSKDLFMCIIFFILYINLKRQAMLIGVPEFIESISNNSELYEREYIDPQDVTLLFPQEKRNLLLIYMESMESTYASKDKGGGKPYNYIPGLVKLAEENLYFSDDNDLGGLIHIAGPHGQWRGFWQLQQA